MQSTFIQKAGFLSIYCLLIFLVTSFKIFKETSDLVIEYQPSPNYTRE